jgi:hypothetical protein
MPRRKNEVILVKVGQGVSWIDSYREPVEAKSALKETTAVRRIRAGHVLIEISSKVTTGEVADSLKKAMRQDTEIVPLGNRETFEIKNIDPIATSEVLKDDAMGKQAVVLLPASTVPKDRPIRIKTWLTIATTRILPNIVGCYRCHMLGHNAARCTALSPGKELCRRCGDKDHTINQCTKEPRCAICAKQKRRNLRHIIGSLACPAVKDRRRNHIVRAR